MAMEKDMTRGTPWKLILSFFFPLLLGNCFQQFYNLVDTIIVGKGISDSALAAVGSTGSLHFFIFGFLGGITNGVSIPIAQAYGAKDEPRLKRVVAQSAITCLSLGLLISVLSVIFTVPLLKLLRTPSDIFRDARIYMQIFCAGLFVSTLYNYCSLPAAGDRGQQDPSLVDRYFLPGQRGPRSSVRDHFPVGRRRSRHRDRHRAGLVRSVLPHPPSYGQDRPSCPFGLAAGSA